MQKTHLLLQLLSACMCIVLICQCSGPIHKEIEAPYHGLQNNKMLDIHKVILTDTATYLYLIPGSERVVIPPEAYLQVKGKKYYVQGSEDLILGEYFYILNSNKDYFSLTFPPLPGNTKSIDLIISEADTGMKIWDIDLTGKVKDYTPDLPPLTDIQNAPLPTFEFAIKKTQLTVHLTGLKEGYTIREPKLIIANLFTQEDEEVIPVSTTGGTYLFDFDLYSTSYILAVIDKGLLEMYLSPGEEAEVHYDVTAFSKSIARYQTQSDIRYAGFKGKLSGINENILRYEELVNRYRDIPMKDPNIGNMTAEQYTSSLFNAYAGIKKEVESTEMPEDIRQLILANLKINVVQRMFNMSTAIRLSYSADNNAIGKTFPSATEKEWLTLADIQLNDSSCLYSILYPQTITALAETIPSEKTLTAIIGTEGLAGDIVKSYPATTRILSIEKLTPEMEKDLRSTSTPYYSEVYTYMLAKEKSGFEQALGKEGFTIQPTPDISDASVLDAIVATYKGKPIFIDYWATWCGPCLAAMETIKPIKEEMKAKGVITLYITDSSSPKTTWAEMLPDIKGNHYYLTKEQWGSLRTKYNLFAIPSYMIFNKAGQLTFQQTGYPGNDKVLEELAKVW